MTYKQSDIWELVLQIEQEYKKIGYTHPHVLFDEAIAAIEKENDIIISEKHKLKLFNRFIKKGE